MSSPHVIVPGPSFAATEIPEVTILREALEWARTMRIRVIPAAHPVECVSSFASVRWVRRDPDAVIDPIGAAILRAQPHATELPDAAAEALNSTIPCCEGLADGLAGEPPSKSWVGSHVSRLYYPGYVAGTELRCHMLSWVCRAHNMRQALGTHCSICLKALS